MRIRLPRLRLPGVRLRGLPWVAGGSALVLGTFLLSFYASVTLETRGREVVVPDLRGLTKEEAHQRVVPEGLVLQVVDQRHDPAVASGRILEQQPLPGSRVRQGRRVKLIISLGGEVVRIPNLVGKSSRTVSLELRREGLIPGRESYAYSRRHGQGTVMAQTPEPGAPAVPGERVDRLVSLGTPPVRWVMPDLRGKPRYQVERWVRRRGFRLAPVARRRVFGAAPGTVLEHSPRPGYPIGERGVIALTVAE